MIGPEIPGRMFCRVLAALTPPSGPGELLIMPVGMPLKELLPYGRDPTSIAFFNTPEIARLYSGVTNNTALDACSISRNFTQSAGGAASRSWLKNEMPCKVTTLSFNVSGASFASALAILREKLSLRRLPTMTATLYGAGMEDSCAEIS